MPKIIPISTVVEKNKLSSAVPFLVCLDITVIDPYTAATVETLRVVQNNEDFTFNGNTYAAANFTIGFKAEGSTQPTIELGMVDYTRALQQRMQAYGGGVGFKVTVSVVNSGAPSAPAELVEFFEVIAATSSDYSANFTLGAESGLARLFPRRRQMRDFCSWRYKSTECGYTGGLASCDLTLNGTNGCVVHANAANFGAFPGINPRNGRSG